MRLDLTLRTFTLCLLVILALGALRSWVTTSRDGLQSDEHWHMVAGASYVQRGDYRLNPEHPPLVKLWVGAFMHDFVLRPFRPLDDKLGERAFVDEAFYVDNDFRAGQRQMRTAMLAFHAAVLAALAFALRRLFGPAVALVAVGLLLVDPTVAAHMPVVLTDLPLTLLCALAVLRAAIAFRSLSPLDLVLASLTLGLALSAKHSALSVVPAVAALGVVAIFRMRTLRSAGCVLAVMLCSLTVLWSCYGLRFAETPLAVTESVFNRPMDQKLDDIHATLPREAIRAALDVKLLPRAYLWGLADVVRVGMEGRQDMIHVFGQRYHGTIPWHFFPSVLLVKLPLGMILLAGIGLVLLVRKHVPDSWRYGAWALSAWGALYLATVMRGNSGYAGIRHALPVLPSVVLLAAFAIVLAVHAKRALQVTIAVATLATLGVVPGMRPWEYFNELAGGRDAAWRSFSDDGLECGMRGPELADYFDTVLRPRGELPYDFYGVYPSENDVFNLDFHALEQDPIDSDVVSGTIFVSARVLSPRPLYDLAVLRAVEPSERRGNLLIYRGTFTIDWLPAFRRRDMLYKYLEPETLDLAKAERMLEEIITIHPQDYMSALELGNMLVSRGARDHALRAYRHARDHAPEGEGIVPLLHEHIAQLSTRPAEEVGPLRNPWLE